MKNKISQRHSKSLYSRGFFSWYRFRELNPLFNNTPEQRRSLLKVS